MRHRSIIGPLLLIAIGGLFLARNIRPDLVSWDAVARYWPFVLIGWGALRLIEVVAWWMRGSPLPRRGVSGGEWAIVILICLIGGGISAAHRHVEDFPWRGPGLRMFGETYDFPVSQQAPAASVSRIEVQIPRGNTRIVGADSQEVKVEGRKHIRAFDRSSAEEANRQSPVELVAEGGRIVVRVKDETAESERRISADLEITVPRGAGVKASGRYGDFDIRNVDGSVEVESGNAGVRLHDVGGNVRVDLRRSDVVQAINVKGTVEVLGRGDDIELENIAGDVRINGYYSGNLQCRNLAKPLVFQSANTELSVDRVAGELEMDLGNFSARNVKGPLALTARSRDIRIEAFTGSVRLKVERGDIELISEEPPTGEIDIATRSGDVELTLPASARFELSASTDRGEVTNGFGPPLEARTEGRGTELKGSTGKGPRISINTRLGSIKVGKM